MIISIIAWEGATHEREIDLFSYKTFHTLPRHHVSAMQITDGPVLFFRLPLGLVTKRFFLNSKRYLLVERKCPVS